MTTATILTRGGSLTVLGLGLLLACSVTTTGLAAPARPVSRPAEAPDKTPSAAARRKVVAIAKDRRRRLRRGDELLHRLKPKEAILEYEPNTGGSSVIGANATLGMAWAYAEMGDFPKAMDTLDQVTPGRYFRCGVARTGMEFQVEDLRAIWRIAALPSDLSTTRLALVVEESLQPEPRELIARERARKARFAALTLVAVFRRDGQLDDANRVLEQANRLWPDNDRSVEVRLLTARYLALAASKPDFPCQK